ncbi:hypothetical protein Esti_006879 [Eimeria stiedai]
MRILQEGKALLTAVAALLSMPVYPGGAVQSGEPLDVDEVTEARARRRYCRYHFAGSLCKPIEPCGIQRAADRSRPL